MELNIYKSLDEIEALVAAFNEKKLPKSKWTHIAHLTVALWYASNFELDEAICRIKSGIINYNTHTGGENTGTGGYHETITIFWMEIIKKFIAENRNLSLLDVCNTFLTSNKATKTYPFEFYTKEKLLSSMARARYIAPDIAI